LARTKSLSKQIRQAREDKGFTVAQLADRIGVLPGVDLLLGKWPGPAARHKSHPAVQGTKNASARNHGDDGALTRTIYAGSY